MKQRKKELNKKNQGAVLELKKQIVKKIRQTLFDERITQKELSKKTGVSYIQINRILNEHIVNPHWSTLNKIMEYLNE